MITMKRALIGLAVVEFLVFVIAYLAHAGRL